MKKRICVFLAMLMLLFLAACGNQDSASTPPADSGSSTDAAATAPEGSGSAAAESAPWVADLSFGSGSATGNSKTFMTAVAKVVTDNVDGVRLSAAVTPNYDVESLTLTYEGTLQGGIGTPISLPMAIAGEPPYAGVVNVCHWFTNNDIMLNFFATESSGIKTIADLKGKKVGLGVEGSSNYYLAKAVIEAEGLTLDDIKVESMSTSEAVEQMKDGHIDAFANVRDYSGSYLELSSSRKIVLVQPTAAGAAAAAQVYPWAGPVEWPFIDRYPDISYEAGTLAYHQPEYVFISADLPDEQVYAMTKAVYENIEVIQSCSDAYSDVYLKDALLGCVIPPHPGALAYYAEQDVPGWRDYSDLLKGTQWESLIG